MSEQPAVPRSQTGERNVIAQVGEAHPGFVVATPSEVAAGQLVELTVGGEVHYLTPQEAETIGGALIVASLRIGAPA